MRPPLKPGAFNFYRELPKEFGCRACKKNKMGVCTITDKEIPITFLCKNASPKWCPKKRGK